MVKYIFVALVVIVVLSLGSIVQADVITSTFEGVCDIKLGDDSFNNAKFIITAVGDTTNRTIPFADFYYIKNDYASVMITDTDSNIHSHTFKTPTGVFCSPHNWSATFSVFGKYGNPAQSLMSTFNSPEIEFWDMTTSIGPVSMVQLINETLFSSEGLEFRNLNCMDSTFTAKISTSAVPEPATMLGFGLPLLMLGLSKIKLIRK